MSKLHATITNENGITVSKGGNDRLTITLKEGNKVVATIVHDALGIRHDMHIRCTHTSCVNLVEETADECRQCYERKTCDDCDAEMKHLKDYGQYCPECWGDVTPTTGKQHKCVTLKEQRECAYGLPITGKKQKGQCNQTPCWCKNC